jgi:putative hydrolase
MRDYFLGLVKEMTAAGADSSSRVGPVISKAIASFREGVPFIDDSGLMGLVASPEQRKTLDRVQALMSLLEGHGHVVMNRLGAELLHTQGRMAALLKGRSQDAKTAFILKLSGLQMKMRQYEDGERFIRGVERVAGWDAIDAAWESPGHLPTIDEIADPGAWLRRVG